MADKFKKIDKYFLLTDSTVNCYGFRLLTAGYQMPEYSKNPIGYYMHGTEEFPREAGVLVKWDDLKMEGDEVYGKPCINLSHPRGQRTVDEVESGFLNAASFGHFVVLEMSNDPKDMLPNQTGPTVTKWFNRECSLVDVPGNFNALKLYDKDENEINLADFTTPNFLPMKQIVLTAAQLAALNLKADAEATAVDTAITNLKAEADKVPGLVQQLAAATAEATKAVGDLAAFKKQANEKAVAEIADAALAARKVTKAGAEKLKADYAGNPQGLKDLVATLQAHATVISQLKVGEDELKAEDWDKLDKEGKLENLKASDPDQFKALFKARFNMDYTGA